MVPPPHYLTRKPLQLQMQTLKKMIRRCSGSVAYNIMLSPTHGEWRFLCYPGQCNSRDARYWMWDGTTSIGKAFAKRQIHIQPSHVARVAVAKKDGKALSFDLDEPVTWISSLRKIHWNSNTSWFCQIENSRSVSMHGCLDCLILIHFVFGVEWNEEAHRF